MPGNNPPKTADVIAYIDEYVHLVELDEEGIVHNSRELVLPSNSPAIFQYQIIVQHLKLKHFPKLKALLLPDGTYLNYHQRRYDSLGKMLSPFAITKTEVEQVVHTDGQKLRLSREKWVIGVEFLPIYSKLPPIYHYKFLIPYLEKHVFAQMKGIQLTNGTRITNKLVVLGKKETLDFGYLLEEDSTD